MFYIKSTNNVKIAVWDWRPEGKETVVLVHGWPLSHKIFEYQIGRLCARGCRVVAMDLRGFGESDAPAAGYSYNEMATDLHQVVCALGLGEFTLAGFSMGGAVALRYMSLFQGKGVKRLMLLAAAAPCWTQRPGFPYGVTRGTAFFTTSWRSSTRFFSPLSWEGVRAKRGNARPGSSMAGRAFMIPGKVLCSMKKEIFLKKL